MERRRQRAGVVPGIVEGLAPERLHVLEVRLVRDEDVADQARVIVHLVLEPYIYIYIYWILVE